jgi:penicillin amidase
MRTILGAVRWLLAALGSLVLLVTVGLGGLLFLTLPSGDHQQSVTGLSSPVDVTFDSDGIPRIHASNATDAATALGYVHARDRMFQMELMRRAASGRLSELFGTRTLAFDRQMRTLGLAYHADQDYAVLSPDTRAILEAYARGVNAWIASRGRLSAPEFLFLGTPERWRPQDCLLWAKTMGLWLSFNWRTELARWRLSGKMPPQTIEALWPRQHEAGHPDAITTTAMAAPGEARAFAAALPAFPALFTQPDRASNEWAVDGRHSATGAPLLAGDPHLGFGFPSLWYLARIDTPQGTLVGATSPGVPLMVLGHNSHIAWTFTTTGADVQDIFIETPVGSDRYQTPDGPKPFITRQERIHVRGHPDEVLTVRETRHGPLISDLFDAKGPLLAVEMGNLQPGDTAAEGLLALDRAQSVEAAGKAAGLITSPVQNLLVADRQKIALFVTGRVPVRRAGDGAMPVQGADGAHDWVGWAAGDQLPHYVAPATGQLVNANERMAPDDFPVFLGRDWFSNWRARRIRELLASSDKHTVEDFARMQMDVTSTMVRQMLPALLSIQTPQGVAGRAFALLNGWDGSMAMDRPQPLIFEAWIGRLYTALMQRNGVPRSQAGLLGPRPEFLPAALLPGGAHWCGEDCAKLLASTLEDAVKALAARYGPDPSSWRWGRAHEAVFAHPILGHVPLLGGLGTLRIPTPGSDTTIFAEATAGENFSAVLGPEYRGVYDLADLDRSRFVLAPGQSGNLLSPLSRNFLRRWRDGETVTLGPNPGSIRSRIRLSP